MLVIIAFALSSVWPGAELIVRFALLSGAAAELGDNLSTTQSAGTEIWHAFFLSTKTFHPSGAAADTVVLADEIAEPIIAIDVATIATKNKIIFALIISPFIVAVFIVLFARNI